MVLPSCPPCNTCIFLSKVMSGPALTPHLSMLRSKAPQPKGCVSISLTPSLYQHPEDRGSGCSLGGKGASSASSTICCSPNQGPHLCPWEAAGISSHVLPKLCIKATTRCTPPLRLTIRFQISHQQLLKGGGHLGCEVRSVSPAPRPAVNAFCQRYS